jgi:hypothetical protein
MSLIHLTLEGRTLVPIRDPESCDAGDKPKIVEAPRIVMKM